ncbi:hypothetical protein [Sorangium sp. So ce1389]|uniref:hypothetical protein n=1 Tax=Sorangium sp. So ce1389 TaxID=3133336 RepID=UPI003F621672
MPLEAAPPEPVALPALAPPEPVALPALASLPPHAAAKTTTGSGRGTRVDRMVTSYTMAAPRAVRGC